MSQQAKGSFKEEAGAAEFLGGGSSKYERFVIDLRRRRFIIPPRVGRFGDLPWVYSELKNLP